MLHGLRCASHAARCALLASERSRDRMYVAPNARHRARSRPGNMAMRARLRTLQKRFAFPSPRHRNNRLESPF
jgi:hypothetical protein